MVRHASGIPFYIEQEEAGRRRRGGEPKEYGKSVPATNDA
jgi:hypothetical protein